MKFHIIALIAVLVTVRSEAQSDSLKHVKEINEQVWKPFITGLTAGNNEAFKALHSKRITRVLIDNDEIKDFESYFPPETNKRQDSTAKRFFELRFDKRMATNQKAWETGYYKGTVMRTGKETITYYGRFYVVLEKENGVWKIMVDADTGKNATKENFEAAAPME